MRLQTGKDQPLINYFIVLLKSLCNDQMSIFVELCSEIKFPIAEGKTVWGCTCLVFLGLLIDTVKQIILLPREKIQFGQELLNDTLNRKSRKVTVHNLQKIAGFLNFLGKAIVPGRAFTQRIYAYTRSTVLKPHHHIRVSGELRADLIMWRTFLYYPSIFARPFIDLNEHLITDEVPMYSDASRNPNLGFGAICSSSWMYSKWDPDFIREHEPSIAYLELWAVVAGIMTWIHRFKNRRIVLFCDNTSAVEMINNTSSCQNCMVLIRILVLESLKSNVRVFAKYISSKANAYSDALS